MPESPVGNPTLSDCDQHGPSRGQRRIGVIICTLVFLILAAFGAVNIQYGLDFTDPGSHLGAATRYHQGDLPFRDEWNHTLGMFDLFLWGALEVWPEAGLYEFQALALGLKLLWLLALVVFLSRYSMLWMLALACIPVAFMTRGVKTPGYNELGQAGLFLALSLWLMASRQMGGRKLVGLLPVLAGVCFTIGALSYTPLILVAIVPLVVFVLDCVRPLSVAGARSATRRFLLTIVLGFGAFVAIVFFAGLFDDYYTAVRWHISIAFGGTPGTPAEATVGQRILRLTAAWLPFVPHLLAVIVSLLLGMVILPRRAKPSWPSGMLLVGVVAAVGYGLWAGARLPTPPRPWGPRFELDFWLVLAAIAVNVVAVITRRVVRTSPDRLPHAREWPFVHGVLIAATAMYLLVQVTFSTNKLLNAVFPAPGLLIIGVADLCRTLRAAAPAAWPRPGGVGWRLAALAMLLAIVGARRLDAAFRTIRGDEAVHELTAGFSHKYLRGIKSTPERVESLEKLLSFLEARMQPGDFVHQEDDFPMLYFLLRARPALPRTWSPARRGFPVEERQRMLDYTLTNERVPQYYVRWNRHEPIVRLLTTPRIVVRQDGSGRTLNPDDPVRRYLDDHYRHVVTFGPFQVFQHEACVESAPSTGPAAAGSDVGARDERAVCRDLTALLTEWQPMGKPANHEVGVNAHGGLEIDVDLSPTEKIVLVPGPSVPAAERRLAALRRFDLRLRVALRGQATATLVLYVCSDETPRSRLLGQRLPLLDGLNSFTVYTAREPVYVWPAFQVAGRGTVSFEECTITGPDE